MGNFCVFIILEFYFKGILFIKKLGYVCNISDIWLILFFVKLLWVGLFLKYIGLFVVVIVLFG